MGPKQPEYGDELDYGNGVKLPRPDPGTDTGDVFSIPEEAFMGQTADDDDHSER